MTDREPVSDALDMIIRALDIVLVMSIDSHDHAEVAAEQVRIRTIISRANLILDLIETRQPVPTTVRRVN